MRYGSVCSGIEAATHAWHPLGWEPAWFSEIAPFPSKVLAHRYPEVPNHGSLVGLADRLVGGDRSIDLLVGGTPCQSHSIAGLRRGLADSRDLTVAYARLAEALRPRWLLWENVPGVLSSSGGRAFGALLGALARLGYGLAWRVLDAQYARVDGYGRAVPQRRERVFVVGCLGDAARAGAVLFEPEGRRGDPPTRRAAGQDVAGTLGGGAPGRGWCDDIERAGAFIPEVAKSLGHRSKGGDPQREDRGTYVAEVASTLDNSFGRLQGQDNQHVDRGGRLFVATAEGGAQDVPYLKRSNLAKQGNNQAVLLCFDETQVTHPENRSSARGDTAALAKSARPPAIAYGIVPESGQGADLRATEVDAAPAVSAVTYGRSTDRGVRVVEPRVAHALRAEGFDASEDGTGRGTPLVESGWRVRRLTPLECERLQGFSDGWTAIPGASDSARYAALGNSMACNVMAWIGRRIGLVEEVLCG